MIFYGIRPLLDLHPLLRPAEPASSSIAFRLASPSTMSVGKNKKLSKGRKGGKKKM